MVWKLRNLHLLSALYRSRKIHSPWLLSLAIKFRISLPSLFPLSLFFFSPVIVSPARGYFPGILHHRILRYRGLIERNLDADRGRTTARFESLSNVERGWDYRMRVSEDYLWSVESQAQEDSWEMKLAGHFSKDNAFSTRVTHRRPEDWTESEHKIDVHSIIAGNRVSRAGNGRFTHFAK